MDLESEESLYKAEIYCIILVTESISNEVKWVFDPNSIPYFSLKMVLPSRQSKLWKGKN